ncbi:MAG: hypothetical protein SO095_05550, partial [Candidatus Onthovivens sp.]|nr:hypothetical protein [Candidatus Onthovivens sp.]
GAFGNEKQNRNYDRLRRRRIEPVEAEICLSFLGTNLKKYFRYMALKKDAPFLESTTKNGSRII